PVQAVARSCDAALRIHDLTSLAEPARLAQTGRCIHELILEPVRVDSGPLFGSALVRLSEQDSVLAVAMEHVVADGFSINLLLRDVVTMYCDMSRGRVLSLPPVPIQFAD